MILRRLIAVQKTLPLLRKKRISEQAAFEMLNALGAKFCKIVGNAVLWHKDGRYSALFSIGGRYVDAGRLMYPCESVAEALRKDFDIDGDRRRQRLRREFLNLLTQKEDVHLDDVQDIIDRHPA